LLTIDDTNGLELRFGNHEAMMTIINMITWREGIGRLLGEGVRRAAEKIGNNAAMYAMEVKGLEIPMHEPRVKAALGLGYMVNPHGADHCANLHDTMFSRVGPFLERFKSLGIIEPRPADDIRSAKVAMFQKIQLFRIASDCLVLCQFVPWNPKQVIDIISAATGWQTSVVELLKVAERVLNLGRLFNIREGFTANDDRLPGRFFEPKTDGVLSDKALNINDFEKAKQYYYILMGWDSISGVPSAEKLKELGIT
jgi:aldehyde:ferredoxin oxidoreductase